MAGLQHLHRPLRHRAGGSFRAAAVFAMVIADRAAVLLGLTLDVIEGAVDRVLHRVVRLLHRFDVVLLAGDQDLADVAVLLHLQDDTHVDDVIEELFDDLVELLRDECADLVGDCVVAPGD